MSTVEKIVAYVQEHQNEYLEVLEKTVNFESYIYGVKEIKNKCGFFLEKKFRDLGFETWHVDGGESGTHICGRYGKGAKKIFLLGHYDTVFPTGTTEQRPFRIQDDKAYGPGIFDMKGGIVNFYMAVKALKNLECFPENTQLTFFFSCDEEGGSLTSKHIIEEMAKEADVCLCAEPGHKGEGYITIERYGRDVITVEAKGVAAHAGNNPQVNPLVELSRQALYIHENCRDDNMLYASIVSFHGGEPGPTAATPEAGYFIVDIRYRGEERGKKAAEIYQSLKPTIEGMELKVSGGVEKPALVQGEYSKEAIDRTVAIIEEMGYEYRPVCLGGGSDGNFTSGVGCPTIDGLGPNGEFLHNPKEYILITTIPQRVGLVAELIRTL